MGYDHETMRILRMLQNADPDGFENEPMDGDYKYFENWGKRVAGKFIWEIYCRGGWADRSDV
jgi:hypothetical protein